MAPVSVLNPRPGERVLDLCAAPGGKSTQIADALMGEGLLVCNEPVPSRAKILSRNIERMGIANALVVSAEPEKQPALSYG
jgi:16S rRNA C967 or C1407 C5-methylase (RsmB/RsmF family)